MAVSARYFRVKTLTAFDQVTNLYNGPWGSCGEVNLLDATDTPLSRTGWTASADSAESIGENGSASNVLDGSNTTIWHTVYTPSNAPQPHTLTIDAGSTITASKLRWKNRADGTAEVNGNVGRYEIHTSLDGSSWTLAAVGTMNTAEVPTFGAAFDITLTPGGFPHIDSQSNSSELTSGQTSKTWPHTVGTQDDRGLLVNVRARDTSATAGYTLATAVTYNGVALTKVIEREVDTFASGLIGVQLWLLKNPPSGTHDVVVTWGTGAPGRGGASAISLFGVDQTDVVENYATNNGQGNTVSQSLTPATSGSLVIDSVYWLAHAATANTGQTILDYAEFAPAGFADVGVSSAIANATGSKTLGWADPGTENIYWVGAIYSVKGASSSTSASLSAAGSAAATLAALAAIAQAMTNSGSAASAFSVQATAKPSFSAALSGSAQFVAITAAGVALSGTGSAGTSLQNILQASVGLSAAGAASNALADVVTAALGFVASGNATSTPANLEQISAAFAAAGTGNAVLDAVGVATTALIAGLNADEDWAIQCAALFAQLESGAAIATFAADTENTEAAIFTATTSSAATFSGAIAIITEFSGSGSASATLLGTLAALLQLTAEGSATASFNNDIVDIHEQEISAAAIAVEAFAVAAVIAGALNANLAGVSIFDAAVVVRASLVGAANASALFSPFTGDKGLIYVSAVSLHAAIGVAAALRPAISAAAALHPAVQIASAEIRPEIEVATTIRPAITANTTIH